MVMYGKQTQYCKVKKNNNNKTKQNKKRKTEIYAKILEITLVKNDHNQGIMTITSDLELGNGA